MKIYLTRHGQTEWNTKNRLQGWGDSALTQKGIMGAKLLAERLEDLDIDIIYSSSSNRAIKTAEIIRGKKDIKIKIEDDLREIHMGSWQGKTLEEINKYNPEAYHNYWYAPHLYVPNNGGESFEQVQKRAVAVIQKIIKDKKHENILVISHGVTLKNILTYYQNKPIKELWQPPFIEGTSLSLIEVDGDDIKVPCYGDCSHLEKE